MESFSLRSPALTLTTVRSSLSRSGLLEKSLLLGQVLRLSNLKTYQHAQKLNCFRIRAQASSMKQFSSESAEATSKSKDSRDENVVFVAGATGKVGSRTVRELLKLGFQVRAGVRSVQKADILVQSVKQIKLNGSNTSEGSQPVEKLEIVECDLEKRDQIRPALGNASVVICCIGASEKEIFDVTGPYRIDYLATKNLVEAATIANVNHFILLTSLGTNKVGFPAAILNLFWGVLIWKRKAEEALIASGLPYTIVRPGGMERPTDAYKETHNITVAPEDSLFGGQVSNLQVAELMACMAKNPGLSHYKIVEVIAETTAPLTPMEELLAKIPSPINVFPSKGSGATGRLTSSPSESVTSEELSIPIDKETSGLKVTKESLSPFVVYDNLKPPTSPTPTPPVGQNNLNVVDIVSEAAADAQSVTAGLETSITEAEPAAEKALTRPLSPYFAYEDLKPPSSPSPTPSGPTKIPTSSSTQVDVVSAGGNDAAKTTETDVEKDSTQNLTNSPFPVNDDIKPQVSTSPTQSVGQQDLKVVDGVSYSASDASSITAEPETSVTTEAKPASQKPLSPYFPYEDLKPPSSPSPTASGPTKKPVSVSTTAVDVASAGGNDTSMTIAAYVEKAVPQSPTYHLSPYPVYDDFKPPTSPSPNAPNALVSAEATADGQPQLSTLSANIAEQNPTPDETTDQEHHTEPKTRPLSPFTMYKDMKPPASPSSSPRKL